MTEYFAFYNDERPHQGLGYRTPAAVHCSGEGGGAEIVDRFGSAAGPSTAPLRSAVDGPAAEPAQRQVAAIDLTSAA
jgi:putative transposase